VKLVLHPQARIDLDIAADWYRKMPANRLPQNSSKLTHTQRNCCNAVRKSVDLESITLDPYRYRDSHFLSSIELKTNAFKSWQSRIGEDDRRFGLSNDVIHK
jgi:hypothetical protein